MQQREGVGAPPHQLVALGVGYLGSAALPSLGDLARRAVILALLAILIAAGCAGWPAAPPTVVFLTVESSASQAPDARLMLELMNGREVAGTVTEWPPLARAIMAHHLPMP